ncbi:MAG: rod shape-determining protein MreC [Eubacteriales bacterium]|nr:rod shape-determining protein MreC [Eubacteriales bacterium]MCI6980152.1 rod shape-determining protein MreC [Clostridiales bacterium]MDY5693450.1 rod shape-determining protein MreC [Eubacteriales bacterium]
MRGILKNKPLIIMLIAILLLGILAFVTSADRSVSWIESTLGSVIQPVQSFAAKASNGIISFVQKVFKTSDADKELEQLQVRMAQLEQAADENAKLKAENERLKKLLNYVETLENYEYVTAVVTGNSQGVWFETFTINAGRNKGIEKDMPVVCAEGLVGRVIEVGANWSKVTAIIDPSSEVSVMVERTRDIGVVRGSFSATSDNQLELYFLPSGFDLVPGDKIVTSGMSSIFPKTITVGTVSEVTRRSAEGSQSNAIIEPAVDFGHLEEVLVLVPKAAEE